MERIQHLINQLAGQQSNGEGVPALLQTVQMLHRELTALQQKGPMEGFKAAVVMPGVTALPPQGRWEEAEKIPSVSIPEGDLPFIPVAAAPVTTLPTINKAPAPYPTLPAVTAFELPEKIPPAIAHTPIPRVFDEEEAPTLSAHRERVTELHEVLALQQGSLNDSLKAERKELGSTLKEAPIKDLRKGIGVNDKFVFISELFRGDEIMYERSIKTINEFRILPEAEYWINRELKVKLGWNDSKDTVQHFYAIVRRRFS